MRTTQGFAINGDHSCYRRTQALHPLEKTRLKFHGIQTCKDASKGIMGWNAVGQFQDRFEPRFFFFPKFFDLYPSFRPTNHAANRDDNNIKQFMPLGPLYPWVVHGCKVGFQIQCEVLLHSLSFVVLDPILSPPFRCDCPEEQIERRCLSGCSSRRVRTQRRERLVAGKKSIFIDLRHKGYLLSSEIL